MSKHTLAAIAILTIMFAVGGYFYRQMPQQMAIHWNARGIADSYGSKWLGLFLIPLIAAGTWLVLWVIPFVDPLSRNIKKFRREYNLFIVVMLLFFLYTQLSSIAYNLGHGFDFTKALMPALALLIFFTGRLLTNAKRNYLIGIRTPWTLSSDRIWDKTHRLGGILFQSASVIILLGVAFPSRIGMPLLLGSVITAVIIPVVYSYLLFRSRD